MIHAIIIDDEINGVKSLELLLEKFVPDVRVVATSTSAPEGVEIINNYRPDVVFLDINMPELSGFELLEKLRFKNFHLIFSTAYQEYALRALKLNASDYLLKPVDLEELKAAIEKIKQKLNEKKTLPDVLARLQEIAAIRNLRIPLPTKNNIEYITSDQIVYIEASSNHALVSLTNGNKETVNSALKDYEALLCKTGSPFMRIHNSFIINLHYINRYLKEDGGYVVMQGKKTIPVSKHKKEEFLHFINLKSES